MATKRIERREIGTAEDGRPLVMEQVFEDVGVCPGVKLVPGMDESPEPRPESTPIKTGRVDRLRRRDAMVQRAGLPRSVSLCRENRAEPGSRPT